MWTVQYNTSMIKAVKKAIKLFWHLTDVLNVCVDLRHLNYVHEQLCLQGTY